MKDYGVNGPIKTNKQKNLTPPSKNHNKNKTNKQKNNPHHASSKWHFITNEKNDILK